MIGGETVPGASFTVGDLRLPRAVLAVLAGAAFGLGGITFQTMLRNPLASPDVIGISSGASAAAVVALLVFEVDQPRVSVLAILAALATALVIYVLSFKDGVVGTRLILVGIGVAAMLDSVVAYVIVRAAVWDLQTAMRWLTGSLNAAGWEQVLPLAAGCRGRRADPARAGRQPRPAAARRRRGRGARGAGGAHPRWSRS